MTDNVLSPYRKGETFDQFIERTGGAGMFTCWVCKEYLHVQAQAIVNHVIISHPKGTIIVGQMRTGKLEPEYDQPRTAVAV